MTSLCLVEDDEELSSLMAKYLQQQGFEVTTVTDGTHAVESILLKQPEITVLDLMLPGKDGLTICRELRPHYQGGILILTASEDDIDHVAGLEIGADDYITKPVKPRVLLARIRMLLRHLGNAVERTADKPATPPIVDSKNRLSFGILSICNSNRSVEFDNQTVALTTSEFDLLWLLANHAEQILTRDFIYRALRGREYDGMDRAIDTNVANLRRKLGDSSSLSKRILTVRGKGYLFVPDNWHKPAI